MDGDMNDILRLLGGLGIGGGDGGAANAPEPEAGLFSEGRMLRIMQAAFSAFGAQRQQDDRANLLRALRPFLSPARARRVDTAITAMRIADVAKVAIYGEEADSDGG
ncbi:MAG: hypothetical protein IKL89_07150 [Clostridia bacterium]|nr:hypothetical protein [Clostridia bacterium]